MTCEPNNHNFDYIRLGATNDIDALFCHKCGEIREAKLPEKK